MNYSLILIDTSYTVFYRFFATIKWYSFAYNEEYNKIKSDIKSYDWITNEIFVSKFEDMFLKSIYKLINKKIIQNSIIIFCMDSLKEDLWRIQINNNYKAKRPNLALKYNYKAIFDYAYNHIIPKIIINNSSFHSIQLNNIEADDIIGCICIYLKKINDKNNIYIISGDNDFLQLGRFNIIFINYKLKKQVIIDENVAKNELKKKILFGDVSDCIKGIVNKNKKELFESDEKLEEFLNLNPKIKEKYIINQKMIDFNFIPQKFYNKVINQFKHIII